VICWTILKEKLGEKAASSGVVMVTLSEISTKSRTGKNTRT
jgi:hypothetical protein